MNISTKFFDDININESEILTFDEGIPGLEEYKKYIILNIEDSKLKCLQSVEEKEIALLIINPWDFFNDYEIQLSEEEINQLEIKSHDEVLVYNIVAIRENKVTANLLAPIVINIKSSKAKQIILNENKYSIRQEIPCLY